MSMIDEGETVTLQTPTDPNCLHCRIWMTVAAYANGALIDTRALADSLRAVAADVFASDPDPNRREHNLEIFVTGLRRAVDSRVAPGSVDGSTRH